MPDNRSSSDIGAALVLPNVNAEVLSLHLAETLTNANNTIKGAIARSDLVLINQAAVDATPER